MGILPSATAGVSVSAASQGAVSSRFLALGSFDGKVRLMSLYSWQVAFVLPLLHPRSLDAGFNCSTLLPTVEVSVSVTTGGTNLQAASGAAAVQVQMPSSLKDSHGRERHVPGVAEATDAMSAAISAAVAGTEAQSAVPVIQSAQIAPTQQLMRSCVLDPANRLATRKPSARAMALLRANAGKSGAAVTEGGERGSGGQEAVDDEEDDDEDSLRQESYFVLKALKALPGSSSSSSSSVTTGGGVGTGASKRVGAAAVASTAASSSAAPSASFSGGFPRVGVSWVDWSCSGALLAAREDAHPRCLWVWRPLQAQLVAVLVLLDPVSCAQWRPRVPAPTAAAGGGEGMTLPPPPPSSSSSLVIDTTTSTATPAEASQGTGESDIEDVLAFCTGNSRVYFWTAAYGVTFVDLNIIREFIDAKDNSSTGRLIDGMHLQAVSLRWSGDGRYLLLRGKESHCVCHVSFQDLLKYSQTRP
jgi:hypothetical protein